MTANSFRKTYGCHPAWWKGAKAIAGDVGDKVPGVDGVGLTTAIKFMKENGTSKGKKGDDIRAFLNTEDYQRNLKLVSLPYPGTNTIRPKQDKAFDGLFTKRFCKLLGIQAPETAEDRRLKIRTSK